jgi:hypothetical protein
MLLELFDELQPRRLSLSKSSLFQYVFQRIFSHYYLPQSSIHFIYRKYLKITHNPSNLPILVFASSSVFCFCFFFFFLFFGVLFVYLGTPYVFNDICQLLIKKICRF